MARDYSKQLSKLRTRRLGLDAPAGMFVETAAQRMAKRESYETRVTNDATKYALGAMQEVDRNYTRVGIEEADRVANQLKDGLETPVEFELQGSVPLNIHIRGISDVDLLALNRSFVTLDWSGPTASTYFRFGTTATESMRKFRLDSESCLQTRYWGASVDVSGGKAITLSGGSFRRKVDVVPSHWHDTAAYQASGQKHDREVKVWDKHVGNTVGNMPFLFMKRINDSEALTNGGLKKTIRLLKNVKSDAEEDGHKIALTSYDVASVMWHCDVNILTQPAWLELTLLAAAQEHLASLVADYSRASQLVTPDGSRKIFDDANKFAGLIKLSLEVDALARQVVAEVMGLAGTNFSPAMIQSSLRKAHIAA
jgi:hypothetical protein